MCKFGILILGGSGKMFVRVGSSRVSGSAHRILSPTWENYLGMVVRAVAPRRLPFKVDLRS